MILIRGIRGDNYARKIENGIVDCRDVLSALLKPPNTGYNYSDYYEGNMVKAICSYREEKSVDLTDPDFLFSILTDYCIPHIYLTYFHVVNEKSIDWLDNFEDDTSFIALNVRLDRYTKTVIGSEYFDARMKYVDDIRHVDQGDFHPFYAACSCSIENLFHHKKDMAELVRAYNTFFFPLLHRERDEKFNDIENEFRIIAYDCPRISFNTIAQLPRDTTIYCKSGNIYRGVLKAGINTEFENELSVLTNPKLSLRDLINNESSGIHIESKFKPVDIKEITEDYRYLGDKEACKKFISHILKSKPREKYVNRTVKRTYDLRKHTDVVFYPGHKNVEY